MSELERVGNHHRKVVAGLEREIAQLVHDRNEWMVKAGKATALASQYLRERDRYREAMQDFLRDWDNGPEDRGTEGKLVDIAAKHADAFRHALNREE